MVPRRVWVGILLAALFTLGAMIASNLYSTAFWVQASWRSFSALAPSFRIATRKRLLPPLLIRRTSERSELAEACALMRENATIQPTITCSRAEIKLTESAI